MKALQRPNKFEVRLHVVHRPKVEASPTPTDLIMILSRLCRAGGLNGTEKILIAQINSTVQGYPADQWKAILGDRNITTLLAMNERHFGRDIERNEGDRNALARGY